MTDCAAPRHDAQDGPSPAEAHAWLCRPCRLGLSRDLRRLPALDHALGILSIVRATPGNGTLPLPFDADISEWRSWFHRNITTITRDVAAERQWQPPADHPWAMCAWLGPQVSRSALHPGWVPCQDWAPRAADVFHRIRARGEQLAAPLEVKHVFLPGACLDCGNGRMQAVIYADHHAGRWSYWVCPVCRTATQIENWWDYPKRLAAMRAQTSLPHVTMMVRGRVLHC